MPDHVPLPTIDNLRAQLYCDPYIQAVEALCPHTVKQLRLRIINSSIDATYQHLQSIVEGSPGANLNAALHQLWSQSTALVTQLLPRFRPTFRTNHSDSAFRLLECFEALIVEDTLCIVQSVNFSLLDPQFHCTIPKGYLRVNCHASHGVNLNAKGNLKL